MKKEYGSERSHEENKNLWFNCITFSYILVAMIYTYGTTQKISPSSTSRRKFHRQGTCKLLMQTFTSYDELKNYLNQSSSSNLYSSAYGVTGTFNAMPAPARQRRQPLPATSSSTAQAATNDYSTTNIQVAGVDEADTVKTDGQYLYVIGNNSQVVYILDASSQNPQNAKVLSEISLNNGYLSGIYLSSDGNKLAVLGSNYISYDVYGKFPGLYPASLVFPDWTTRYKLRLRIRCLQQS